MLSRLFKNVYVWESVVEVKVISSIVEGKDMLFKLEQFVIPVKSNDLTPSGITRFLNLYSQKRQLGLYTQFPFKCDTFQSGTVLKSQHIN